MNRISTFFVAAAAVVSVPGMALAACPNGTGGIVNLPNLARMPESTIITSVVAGGGVDLSQCPVPGFGFIAEEPDFRVRIDTDPADRLLFEAQADCDAVLLVQTPNRNWFFDDDDGSGTDPRIVLRFPSQGYYDIWVGTLDEQTCDANFMIWTEPRGGFQSVSY